MEHKLVLSEPIIISDEQKMNKWAKKMLQRS